MFQSPYDPGVAQFGGGSSHTVMHPLVAALLVVLALAILLLPRKYVIAPLLLGLLLIPAGQNLYLGGLHFYTASILISFGCVRMLWSKFSSHATLLPGGFGTLDKVFVIWASYRAFAGILQFVQAAAVPNQLALFFNAIGGYFLFRFLIRTDEDIARAIKVLAVVALFAAVSMLHEQRTLENWFGQLGGIRPAPEVRNGRIRSQAFFQHALLAGSVGATMFPLFLWLFVRGKGRLLAALGAAAALVMVYTASTSTPLMALAGGIFAICLWPLRKNMRLIRWGIVLGLIGLQLAMKAPFWFVMGHIDLAGGSTGWDRAMLIDNFLHHLGNWWLIGTHSNATWGWDMWDECNQFIAEGLGGGLVCLTCFVAMFALCFKKLGKARKAVAARRRQQWLIWLFAAALFTQAMAYFGIDYFDQSKYVWYLLLVMLGTTTAAAMQSSAVRKTKPAKFQAAEPEAIPVLVAPAAVGSCAEAFSR